MKLFFVKHLDGSITTSNWPITENDLEGVPYEVNEDDLALVQEGVKDWVIVDGAASVIDSDRKAKQDAAQQAAKDLAEQNKLRKIELIQKVNAGTATAEELTEFANLL